MIIGIDHGYYAIKTAHTTFSAGITEYTHEPFTKHNVLEYCGKYYVCGTGRQPIQRTKTETQNYFLLTLAAIAKELKHRAAPICTNVTIAAGLPLASYGREKMPFKAYLMSAQQPVKFKFDGIQYEVTIENVSLFPQGYSAIVSNSYLLKDEPSVLLVDAGGWTIDLMRLDNGKPNADTCRSLELGMIRCMDEITEQVRRDTGLSVTQAQVEQILNGGHCSIDEKAQYIIKRQGRRYVQNIFSSIMESGFDLKAIPVIVIGGGASKQAPQKAAVFKLFVEEEELRSGVNYDFSKFNKNHNLQNGASDDEKRNIRPEDRLCRAVCE